MPVLVPRCGERHAAGMRWCHDQPPPALPPPRDRRALAGGRAEDRLGLPLAHDADAPQRDGGVAARRPAAGPAVGLRPHRPAGRRRWPRPAHAPLLRRVRARGRAERARADRRGSATVRTAPRRRRSGASRSCAARRTRCARATSSPSASPARGTGRCASVDVDAEGFTLATLDGHLEAGRIRFSARDLGPGRVEIRIEAWARGGDRVSNLLFDRVPINKEVQLHMWTSVLERLIAMSGGRRDGPAGHHDAARRRGRARPCRMSAWPGRRACSGRSRTWPDGR